MGMEAGLGKIGEIPSSEIDVFTDTRVILAHARQQAIERNLDQYVIVDVDSHHTEAMSWTEVIEYIEDPVVRFEAIEYHKTRVNVPPYGINNGLAFYQEVGGRIPHTATRREVVEETDVTRDVVLSRRAMESLGIDYMVLFPQSMLALGVHPQIAMEVQLARAYNRWLVDRVLSVDKRIKSLIYLPFNDPDAALRTVEEFTGEPGVIGFMVTSIRNRPVHDNQYMKLYAALEERAMPLAFHSGYTWQDNPIMAQINRFIGVHALGFVFWNMLHMTNWILNGLPERFRKLKVVWIESGLAWIPFLMQRLDSEYMKRTSEAPLLKRRPSEYMREMYYTSQPMETDNIPALKMTCEMINAETQVMYASDWPHWDFELPSTILDLPFISDKAKRNILGETALKVFDLDRHDHK